MDIVLLCATTTREDVFNDVCELMKKYNLPMSKLFSVATDGAPYITKNKGFVSELQKKKKLNLWET